MIGACGLSIAGLARAVEVNEKSVHAWIKKGWKPSTPELRARVAEALHVEPAFLWGEP